MMQLQGEKKMEKNDNPITYYMRPALRKPSIDKKEGKKFLVK